MNVRLSLTAGVWLGNSDMSVSILGFCQDTLFIAWCIVECVEAVASLRVEEAVTFFYDASQ